MGVRLAADGTKTVIRAAGTKLQVFDVDAVTFTNQAEDTAAVNTDFLSPGSSQPVVFANFDTPNKSVLWAAGGGMSKVYGYTGTGITENGVPSPTGTFTVNNTGSGSGDWAATGDYTYALVLRKTSTQALSNAALDEQVTISNALDEVDLTFPTVDSTKYDRWYIYRSAVAGTEGFTTGVLVAQVPTTDLTYTDLGNVAVSESEVVPRTGNISLDNSQLEAGTYKCLTTFKRRLIAARNNTIQVSDLNKPESWSQDLIVNLPYGGPITGLASIGFNAPITSNVDEYLVIFQERYMWVITGTFAFDDATGLYDFELKYVDAVGCAAQPLIVNASGYICWMDYRGVYAWSGAGKPIYMSRPIENIFEVDGSLNKTKLFSSYGMFLRQKNMIQWIISDRTLGENKVALKLDLRLTVPQISQNFERTVADGVFIMDTLPAQLYSGAIYLAGSGEEIMLSGDDSGFIWKLFSSVSDDGVGVQFSYESKYFNLGDISSAKRYKKVIVWINESVPKDLTLNYWTNYRKLESEKSELAETMAPMTDSTASRWDIATWDVSNWDEYSDKQRFITFNLNAKQNNNEGDAIKLKFIQNDASAPVTILGYTIVAEPIAMRK